MQVSFDEIEEEPDTYEENRFAPPGASPSKLDDAAASLTVHPAVETFYSLREVVTVYKDEFERDINHTVTYETRSTFLSLDNPNNATHGSSFCSSFSHFLTRILITTLSLLNSLCRSCFWISETGKARNRVCSGVQT
jgi:hypothetical protein